jgi:hypothetical protein
MDVKDLKEMMLQVFYKNDQKKVAPFSYICKTVSLESDIYYSKQKNQPTVI